MEFHVGLVGRKDLTGEIYRQLRRAILDGRLAPGGRLPPTRELARQSLYGVDTPPQPGLIFACGAIPTSRIAEGLDRLRRCFDD